MRSDFWGTGFLLSHPCAQMPAQGWGTELLWTGKGTNTGPSTAPRSAQDDRLCLIAGKRESRR